MGWNSIDTTLLILITLDFSFALVMGLCSIKGLVAALCEINTRHEWVVYMKPARCIEAQSRFPSIECI